MKLRFVDWSSLEDCCNSIATDPLYHYLQGLRHIKLPFPTAYCADENQEMESVRRKFNDPFNFFWAWPQTAVALLQYFPPASHILPT